MKFLGLASVGLAALCVTGAVNAQTYPSKPVRIIVPFPPGGGTDIQARLLQKNFHNSMKQTFIVENRTGASGLIGGEAVAKAPPDGHTILFTTSSLSVSVTLYADRIKFDPLQDLEPISWISSVPLVLVVHPSVPAKSVKELVALARKTKGKMVGASSGIGTTSSLGVEMLKQMSDIDVVHVPFKGGGPSMVALISGETDFLFAVVPAAQSFIQQGKIRGLAVTIAERVSALPDLPTMNTFYPGFELDNWYAMFFPKGTPKPMVEKINSEIRKAIGASDMKEFMKREAINPVGSSPEALMAKFKKEIAKYAKVIKATQVTVQ